MQALIIIAVVMFTVVAAWSVRRVGMTKNLTISKHVSKQRATIAAFGIIGTLATLLASLALFFWLLPLHHAHGTSYFIFSLLMLGFLLAALVPHVEKTRKGVVHSIAAWGMCYLIPFAIVSSLWWSVPVVIKTISLVLLVVSVILLILSLTKKELRRSMLIFQSAYLGIFFLFLLVVSFS